MTTIAYFSNHMVSEQCNGFFVSDYDGHGNSAAMRVIIVGIGLGFLAVELVQMSYLKLAYFEDFWNFYMVTSIVTNVYLVFEHVYSFSNIHYDTMIQISSVAIALQWFVLYYWMRLVPSLAFFVSFLVEVVGDISGFLVMFGVCIIMFGNGVFVIYKSMNDPRSAAYPYDEDLTLITHSFGNEFIDSLFA